jgi:hypothetical protein
MRILRAATSDARASKEKGKHLTTGSNSFCRCAQEQKQEISLELSVSTSEEKNNFDLLFPRENSKPYVNKEFFSIQSKNKSLSVRLFIC